MSLSMAHARHWRILGALDRDAKLVGLHAEHRGWSAGASAANISISSVVLVVVQGLIGLEKPILSQCSQVLRRRVEIDLRRGSLLSRVLPHIKGVGLGIWISKLSVCALVPLVASLPASLHSATDLRLRSTVLTGRWSVVHGGQPIQHRRAAALPSCTGRLSHAESLCNGLRIVAQPLVHRGVEYVYVGRCIC